MKRKHSVSGYYDILIQLTTAVAHMMKFDSKNSSKTLNSSLILLHAARLVTRLMSVRPAVDLNWKALV